MNFAITGVAGFVAPRHLNAIRDTGHRLVAAVDPHDAVGLLDRYSFGVRFFTEIERFDRHLEKLRRSSDEERVHYVSICSPNYLHDAHIRLALRAGAHAICEKPIVINPWNLDPLQELERESGMRINTVLQLRLHPSVIAFRQHDRRRGQPASPGDADLRHRPRPLVRRLVEGFGGAVGRHRHEHRHPLLRPAALAVRRRAAIERAPARCCARGRLARPRARRRSLVPLHGCLRPAVCAGARRPRHIPGDDRGRRCSSSSATASTTCTRGCTKTSLRVADAASTRRARRSN